MSKALLPHDIAVLKKVDRVDTGDVVHMFSSGEEAIKCQRSIGGESWAFSFNEEFEAFPCDEWKVKGLCVGRIRTGPFKIVQFTEFPGGLKWSMRQIDI